MPFCHYMSLRECLVVFSSWCLALAIMPILPTTASRTQTKEGITANTLDMTLSGLRTSFGQAAGCTSAPAFSEHRVMTTTSCLEVLHLRACMSASVHTFVTHIHHTSKFNLYVCCTDLTSAPKLRIVKQGVHQLQT